jgi:hypothetical protein
LRRTLRLNDLLQTFDAIKFLLDKADALAVCEICIIFTNAKGKFPACLNKLISFAYIVSVPVFIIRNLICSFFSAQAWLNAEGCDAREAL